MWVGWERRGKDGRDVGRLVRFGKAGRDVGRPGETWRGWERRG